MVCLILFSCYGKTVYKMILTWTAKMYGLRSGQSEVDPSKLTGSG